MCIDDDGNLQFCYFDSWSGRGEQSPLETHLTAWVDKGATWIGGCCRIKPHDIKTLKEYVEHIVKQRESSMDVCWKLMVTRKFGQCMCIVCIRFYVYQLQQFY